MKFLRHPRPLLLVISIVLGALDSWSLRYRVNPMGISYLDIGEALMRGEWRAALNGLWSPLYSVPLGLMTAINPRPEWEFPLMHFVNFLIFLAALFAFDLFMREVVRAHGDENGNSTSLTEPALTVLGYAIFLWSTLGLITMATTAPDLMLSIFVYLAFAKLLQIKRGVTHWCSFFMLGLILGIGYLAKATMFPIAPLVIVSALVFARRHKGKTSRQWGGSLAAAVVGFLLIVAPLVLAFSVSKQRLSFGDSGRLNYLWHVNRVPPFHWQGNDVNGIPVHPTRRISDHPRVFEFATPFNATYPPWYDPSYWYQGAQTKFNLGQQRVALLATARVYVQLLTYTSNLVLLAGFLLLLYLGRKDSFRQLLSAWPLLLLVLAAFCLYLPVHVEPRYVAAFIPPLWVILFASLRLPSSSQWHKLTTYAPIVVGVLLLVSQTLRSAGMVHTALTDAPTQRVFESSLVVATELKQRGINAGDPVGLVNFDPFWLPRVDWARLARVRIVAELPNTEAGILTTEPATQGDLVATFARTGAKAVVAVSVPRDVNLPGWERIGDTSYYLRTIDQPSK